MLWQSAWIPAAPSKYTPRRRKGQASRLARFLNAAAVARKRRTVHHRVMSKGTTAADERIGSRGSPGSLPRAGDGGTTRALVVALIGLPGAGKSTVAAALERELGLRRVCRDAIRQAMFPRCEYSFVEKRAAFRTVLLAVEINCLLGEPTVIDGMTFSRRADFDELHARAERHGYDVLPLFIDCPTALARERIARDLIERAHPAADREPELVDRVARRFDPPPAASIRIDAARPMDEVCRLAIAEVAARLGRSSAHA
jgi:predicted kinase